MDANFGGGMAIGWMVWLLIVVLFWGLVIAAIVLAIRWLIRADRRGSHEAPQPQTPWRSFANAMLEGRSTRPSTSADGLS